MYPSLVAELIQNPKRLYAFPILGFLVKSIVLIPVLIELLAIEIALFVLLVINSFIVLFTGQYWPTAYNLALGLLRLSTKASFFVWGLTDKYPGFGLDIEDNFSLDIDQPWESNRFFAVPLVGALVRLIFLIPFGIYSSIVSYGAYVGVFFSSFPVLFAARYPESTFELARDSVRLQLAVACWGAGLSDSYPSFWISMNHQTIKIILIVAGALLALLSNLGQLTGQAQ